MKKYLKKKKIRKKEKNQSNHHVDRLHMGGGGHGDRVMARAIGDAFGESARPVPKVRAKTVPAVCI